MDGKIGNENIGDVKSTSLTKIPYGWHECDGSAISRTTYSELFNLFNTETYDDDPTHTLLSVYGIGDGSDTFNLPDYREVALVGVGKNTTNIFDSTETDPSTGQAGTQNHDIYTVGYFGDDRFQGHGHERKYMISIGDDGSGVVSNASYGSNFIVSNAIGLPAKNERTSAYGDPRYGMTTRTKQKGVIFIIKIL